MVPMILRLLIAVLVSALLLGGGAREGYLADVFVQMLSVPLLLLGCWRLGHNGEPFSLFRRSSGRLLMGAAIMFVAAALVHLLPFPAGIISDRIAAAAHEAGVQSSGWLRQISLTPARTWIATISGITPLAVFVGASQLNVAERFKLTWVVIGLGVAGLLLGFLQIAQMPESSLRFFEFTSPSDAVGFFANRNHFAASLYTMLIFASVRFAFTAGDFVKPGALRSRAVLWFAAATALLIATVAGLAMARSRAGIFLTMAAIAGIAVMVSMKGQGSESHEVQRHNRTRRAIIIALGAAVLFVAQFGLGRVLTRFEADPLDDLRWALAPATLNLALQNLPFGTGLGSFVPVYAGSEQTANLFTGYANRAHNDWIEFLLETGVFGIITGALFLSWFGSRAAALWRQPGGETDRHLLLQRGAVLVIALLLAHSLVDYPLRTTALASVFAFACAILIKPPANEPQHVSDAASGRRKKRQHSRPGHSNTAPPFGDNEWAEAWKRGEVRIAD